MNKYYLNPVNMNKREVCDSFHSGCYESPLVEIAELDVEGVLCDSNIAKTTLQITGFGTPESPAGFDKNEMTLE